MGHLARIGFRYIMWARHRRQRRYWPRHRPPVYRWQVQACEASKLLILSIPAMRFTTISAASRHRIESEMSSANRRSVLHISHLMARTLLSGLGITSFDPGARGHWTCGHRCRCRGSGNAKYLPGHFHEEPIAIGRLVSQ